jgi:tRNA (uracil-5-)-methyltransferase TRM9
MNQSTIERLNQINRAFYATIADEFHQTRGEAWLGWQRLLPHVSAPLSVLDVGCGNGRFGVFLAEEDRVPLTYVGLDNSVALLEHARRALGSLAQVQAELREHDIIEAPNLNGEVDLVVLFGVMHHVPSKARRLALMRTLSACMKTGGLLIFACWRFYEYPRFRERITPFPPDLEVEAKDYLLDWRRGAHALRYCHYVDDAEHAELIAASGMQHVETYRADGASGDANCYSVLRKE